MIIKLNNRMIEVFPGKEAPTDLLRMRSSKRESFGAEFLRKNTNQFFYSCLRVETKKLNIRSKVEETYSYTYLCREGRQSVFEFKIKSLYISTLWSVTDGEHAKPTDLQTMEEALELSLELAESLIAKKYKYINV